MITIMVHTYFTIEIIHIKKCGCVNFLLQMMIQIHNRVKYSPGL